MEVSKQPFNPNQKGAYLNNSLSEQRQNQLSLIFSSLKLSQLLRTTGIHKSYGVSSFAGFQIIFQSVFQGCNLYRLLEGTRAESLPSKDVVYRFLNDSLHNWRRFYQLLSLKVVGRFEKLTSAQCIRVFIVDDSVMVRERNKKVELLARFFDHVSGRFIRGYRLLTLGWSDAYSFAPIDFTLMSSAKAKNRLCEMREDLDKRSIGYKRRMEALNLKPDAVVQMFIYYLKISY